MIQIKNKNRCCGCSACFNVCPTHAISMQEDEEGFLYPVVAEDKCVKCNKCDKVCPYSSKAISMPPPATKCYAAYAKDEKIRLSSSSGGIFPVLAIHTIKQRGCVFGAAFSSSSEVCHICASSLDDLEGLKGSKYLPSRIGNSFAQAREELKKGRFVLFSGTPCQINGLLAFLQKPYKNLCTVEIVCHGVPSPIFWKSFLAKNTSGPVKTVAFRDKDTGWVNYSLSVHSDVHFKKLHSEIPFFTAFIDGYSLRPSCFSCPFKLGATRSDITIGDFWGVEKVVGITDDKGVSFVSINTQKGASYFESVKNELYSLPVDAAQAIHYNRSITTPTNKPARRERLFELARKRKEARALKRPSRLRRCFSAIFRKMTGGRK